MRVTIAVCSAALLASLGCRTGDSLTPPSPPTILASDLVYDPGHALGAVVRARAADADSAAVWFQLEGSNSGEQTPAVALAGDSAVVPILGLRPGSRYAWRLVVWGNNRATQGSIATLTTGVLPPDLPSYDAGGSDPSPGYVAFAAGMYGVVIDNTGRVVWYHRFANGPGLNFQVQPNGRYYARPSGAAPSEAWLEVDPLGQITRTFGCARGLPARFHDLLVEPDGSYWLLCDETRVMDLSALGGRSSATVIGTNVQHVGAEGLRFEWTPFDHFAITDLELAERTGATVNWTHANALDRDADGNLLVSSRNLNEITKIDPRTGRVVWRMGGRANQFAFEGTSSPPYLSQHGLRATGPASLLLLDNLGDGLGSRAERYEYDESRMTVTLAGAYRADPRVAALLGGTTQQLAGGRTLVAYGNGGRVEEYDSSGNVVWRVYGNAGYVFRAQRIASLYHPGLGLHR